MPLVLAARAMACRFELVLDADDELAARAAGEAALAEVEELAAVLDPFARDSAVSDLNRRAATAPVRVDSELLELLERCLALGRETGGGFDPTMGALMALHGFRGPPGPPPEAAAVTALHGECGLSRLQLDREGRRVAFTSPKLALDLGGVAKGLALDRAAELLQEAGITRALLHAGTSTVLALDPPRDRAAWTVGIRHPEEEGMVATVDLVREALGVSAPHGRQVGEGESLRGHVLDPRTGHPVAGARLAAVLCGEALAADAWSTARLVEARSGQGGPPTLVIDAGGRVARVDDPEDRFREVAPQ